MLYPLTMIADTEPPAFSSFAVPEHMPTTADVVWLTDEYAICTLHYGTQPGQYNLRVAGDGLHHKSHGVQFTGLVPTVLR